MPVPWLQIVQLMPSILDVSRELLGRTRGAGKGGANVPASSASGPSVLEARIAALEENERRQAELVTTMADQLAQLTTAVTSLHSQTRRLLVGQIVTAVVAVVAVIVALR